MSTPQRILALDAAYGAAAACLLLPDKKPLLAVTDQATPHSRSIIPMLHGQLEKAGVDWQQLDMLAVGAGPGSFTGLRVAAATISGLNASLGLPVMPVSSLAITALQADTPEKIWVIEDARSGDAYVGCYKQGEPLQADQCLPWEEVVRLPAANFVGLTEPAADLAGWQKMEASRCRAEALAELIILQAERGDLASLPRRAMPVYMQPSQAERKAAGG